MVEQKRKQALLRSNLSGIFSILYANAKGVGNPYLIRASRLDPLYYVRVFPHPMIAVCGPNTSVSAMNLEIVSVIVVLS